MKNSLNIITGVIIIFWIILSSCTFNNDVKYSISHSSADIRWPLIELQNVSHHLVFKEQGKYASFPTLAIDPGNDYLYTRFTVKDSISHVGKELNERIITMESRDGGVTWHSIEVFPLTALDSRPLRPGLLRTGQNNETLHGGAFKMPDGALARIGHYWRRWLPVERLPEFEGRYEIMRGEVNRGPGPEFFAYNSGGYLERSEDNGKTWQHTDISELDTYASFSSPWSYDQLPDGTVIRTFAVKKSADDLLKVVAVITHNGRTAQLVDVMGNEPGYRFTEESLLHVTSTGVIWMLTRVHDTIKEREHNNLWQAVSYDGGRSWTSIPSPINIGRSPASGLVQLDDGRLILVAGHRRSPHAGIHVLISEDEGLTWRHDRRIALRQDGHGFDLGYPCAVKMSDGTVVAIYYFSTAEEVEKEGYNTRSIIATRFRVPEFD